MIVGIHGIGQQQVGRRQLLRDWAPALGDGLEFAVGNRVDGVSFDLAFYGDLFLRPATPELKGGGEDGGIADVGAEETADLVEAAREVVTDAEIAAADRALPHKAYTRTPRPVQVVLRALDVRFGPAAGVLYLGTLRQVRRYLHDPVLKARVDAIVAAAVGSQCRIVVGHSLGSVVALEFVRQHPDHPLDLLLTLGSPLGLRMVQSRLAEPFFGATASRGIPKSVAGWVNVRDVRDPVACAGDLGTWWPGVEDRRVDNEGDAHNVARYLSKREAGSAIAAAARLGPQDGQPGRGQ